MHVLGVVGPRGSDTTRLVERLTAALSGRGRVATVAERAHAPTVATEGKNTDRYRRAGAAITAGIDGEGHWVATGRSTDLDRALDRLAPRCDYALVEGFGDADLPQVALGDAAPDGEVLARAPTGEGIDVSGVIERLEETAPRVTLESLVERAKAAAGAEFAGAIATFTGRVRAKERPDDARTERLEFERYDGVAAERIEAIGAELETRPGVHAVLAHHRTGVLEAGEDIVFVVVLAGHRTEAFRAVEDGIDRIKAEVPLFKKEVTVEGDFWAHDHPE